MTRREHDWVLTFEDHSTVQIECLWRLLRNGRIVLTGEDHGLQFGMAAPIDAANSCNIQLAGRAISSIELTQGTLDLTFTLEGSLVLQIIPDSSGYEAWNANTPNGFIVAVGGGELTVFKTE
ncbi:MAG: DUF6188 family protein [Pirellulaceae bacterium]|nr:DUF6188 family protein [Pirellulaceae bacterium]